MLEVLERLGIGAHNPGACHGPWIVSAGSAELTSSNPANNQRMATARAATIEDYDRIVEAARASFSTWRSLPAPQRGEVVRRIGEAVRQARDDLGLLITLETGKILSEGIGEVQEMIDMCDFAVGLSRQLHGLTIASERSNHRMMEQWHPLGPIGVITAFNFPLAVWAWNAMLAAVCGDTIVWKPSPRTPLTAIAIQHIVNQVVLPMGHEGVFNLCLGEASPIGERMLADERLPLISATGSCDLGRRVAAVVGARLGRTLLELGGNNAAIVTPTAPLELAIRSIVFAAVGTTGQRCTTLRRLIVHESLIDSLVDRLAWIYRGLRIGDPWDPETLVGPLVSESAADSMQEALRAAEAQGGRLVCGGRRLDRPGIFVEPAIVRAIPGMPVMQRETFAPILYVLPYTTLDEAIDLQNSVEQGLSSAIFTTDLVEAERFLAPEGSDCGIANVNIGTSGAEIGGAFGGEKATGGGREAGSDSWKAYMRRQTCTINRGRQLPLAQGVRFEIAVDQEDKPA